MRFFAALSRLLRSHRKPRFDDYPIPEFKPHPKWAHLFPEHRDEGR